MSGRRWVGKTQSQVQPQRHFQPQVELPAKHVIPLILMRPLLNKPHPVKQSLNFTFPLCYQRWEVMTHK